MTEFNHHGIQGQKWGVVNGPPYPLDRAVSTGKALKSTLKARHEAHVAEKHKKLAAKIISTNQKIEYYEAKNKLQNQKLLYREGKSKEFFMLPTGETLMDRNARKKLEADKNRDFQFKVYQEKNKNKGNTVAGTVKQTLLDVGKSLATDALKDVGKPFLDDATQKVIDKRFPEKAKARKDREKIEKRNANAKNEADFMKSQADYEKAKYQIANPKEAWGKNNDNKNNKNNNNDEEDKET